MKIIRYFLNNHCFVLYNACIHGFQSICNMTQLEKYIEMQKSILENVHQSKFKPMKYNDTNPNLLFSFLNPADEILQNTDILTRVLQYRKCFLYINENKKF